MRECTRFLVVALLFSVHFFRADSVTRVAVVGAGISGLAAARTLVDNWPDTAEPLEVVVLEARTRIGGRIHTLSAAETGWTSAVGPELDIGAAWIHESHSSNPLTKIVEFLNLGTVWTDDEFLDVYTCPSENTTCTVLSDLNERWADYEELRSAAALKADDAGSDLSLWAAMTGLDANGLTREDPVAQFHLMRSEELALGASAEQISGREFDSRQGFGPGSVREVLVSGGFAEITDALAEGRVRVNEGAPSLQVSAPAANSSLDVRLGQRVTEVEHGPSGVTLQIAGAEPVQADYAIVSVPLGVLQAGSITFSPAMDTIVATALAELGVGQLFKVSLKFNSGWWTPTQAQQFFGRAITGPNRRMFNYFLNGQQVLGQYVLCTFAAGEAAASAEAMSDAAVWGEVRASLVALFGEATVPLGMPEMVRSAWGEDALARGAFAYPKVGNTEDAWRRTRMVVGLNVWLAGEHTSPEHFASAAGAFIAGQRAARSIFEAAGVFKEPAPAFLSAGSEAVSTWAYGRRVAVLAAALALSLSTACLTRP